MKQLTPRFSISLFALSLALTAPGCSSSPAPGADAKLDVANLDLRSGDGVRPDIRRVDSGALTLQVVNSCTVPDAPASGTINTAGDVVYSATGQTLDIAWPKGKGPFPLIILIHGGGWSGGDKSEFAPDAERLAGVGYAAATINYRLAQNPTNLYPACIEDVRCAVRWLRGKASTYSIDTTRVAVAGPSAGGNLALMVALADTVAGLDGGNCSAAAQPVRVTGAISFYGVTDMRATTNLGPSEKDTLSNLFGQPPEQAITLSTLASPIVHVTAKAPPILMIHGTADDVVPISHSRNLRTALDKVGTPSLLVEVSGEGHDFPLFSSQAQYLRHSCTALAFFQAIFK